MDSNYIEVIHAPEGKNNVIETSWKPLLRQIYICTGVWACYFNFGLCFGAPTVFIPQIRKEANSNKVISMEMASWLSSCLNYSAIPFAILLSYLPHRIGRKRTILFVATMTLIGFIVLFTSRTTIQLLISEIIQGPVSACQLTITLMVITEYSSPCYRGIFLTLKSATFLWGVWVSNTIGTYTHWTNIALLGCAISFYAIVTILFWPESPYWLASQVRFEECIKSHRWLKGKGQRAEEELKSLINSRQKITNHEDRLMKKRFFNIRKAVCTRTFDGALKITVFLIALYVFSGKLACAIYAIDMIKKITGNEDLAYKGMLILDGITVIGAYIGCGLSKIIKRKIIVTTTTLIGVKFLLLLSIYLYIVELKILGENNYISMILLTGYSLAISCGPMIMLTSIVGEIIPLKSRSLFTLFIAILYNSMMGTMLKTTPFIYKNLGTHGTFLFYAIAASFMLMLVYKFVPETKDKTLVEIENYMQNGEFVNIKEQTVLKSDTT